MIAKRGRVLNKAKQVQSRYARYSEDMLTVLLPILDKHGFTLTHTVDVPPERSNMLRTTGRLTYGGHTETSEFEAPADDFEYRTHVQSLGSTRSYGRRYTTRDLLNLIELGMDDDGRAAGNLDANDPSRRRDEPHYDADGEKPITQPQVNRLFDIFKSSGRTTMEWKGYLRLRYGIEESTQIKRKDYDAIVSAVQAPGPLPVGEAL